MERGETAFGGCEIKTKEKRSVFQAIARNDL
jgi:hypothetical protein